MAACFFIVKEGGATRFILTFSGIFLIALCMLFPGTALAEKEKEAQVTLKNFTLVVVQQSEDIVVATLLYKKKPVHEEGEAFASYTVDDVRHAFPSSDCETVKVNLTTGGANCCFGNYLLTACAGGDYAVYMSPLMGIKESPVHNTFSIADPFFMYYEPHVAGQDNALVLSRADSPAPLRLLVFNDGWRVDAVGEFPEYYLKLADNTVETGRENTLAGAVLRAYYLAMAARPRAEIYARFQKEMPKEYAAFAEQAFKDIETAVAQFDPIVSIGH